MIKITLESPGNFVFNDVPEPEPGNGEALVDIRSMGICAGDISQYMGKKLDLWPLPQVQCHEFGGIVKKVNDASGKIKEGDKVSVSNHLNCGNCYYCNNGLELTCDNDKVYGINIEGGMAERVVAPVRIMVKLSESFDIRYAGIIEPAAIAYNLVKGVKNSNIMIIGSGSIGLMAIPIARYFGNKVIAVDIDNDHLKTAEKLGADLIVNFNDRDRDKKLEESFGKERVDYIGITHIDQQVIDWSMEVLRRCGIIAFIDIVEDPFYTVNFRKMWSKIITLKGLDSIYFKDFEEAVKLLEKDVIDIDKVVSKTFPMEKVKEAYEYKIRNNALKVFLTR